jgi:hypothetical protein
MRADNGGYNSGGYFKSRRIWGGIVLYRRSTAINCNLYGMGKSIYHSSVVVRLSSSRMRAKFYAAFI